MVIKKLRRDRMSVIDRGGGERRRGERMK